MAQPPAADVPLAACAPFALLLAAIAVLPLAAPHWWERHRNKALVALLLGGVSAAWTAGTLGAPALAQALTDYVAFVVLIGALFTISGGLYLEGDLRATPTVNAAFLGAGALLASVIGTTGASMVLIRPVLRTNRERQHVAHTVVFFIFLVSNVGGCLTPLGDPPLFLGYLRGVPFAWTLGLWREWAAMSAALLAIYWVIDARAHRRETHRDLGHDARAIQPLRLRGGFNLVLLAAAVATVALVKEPAVAHAEAVRDVVLVGLALISLRVTPEDVHERNEFAWGPLVEVGVLFAGIFATMVPALRLLELHGAELGLSQPWHFFWASGALSSFLDNAPTYLAFGSVATGMLNAGTPGLQLSSAHLGGLLQIDPLVPPAAAALAARTLTAISLGAVFMGANTYIGNGPNFLVKALAESRGVRMPSFAGYMVWSAAVLLPLFTILTLVFLA